MARRKAPKRRTKANPPLTAEEIRLRHAASIESGWRRTAREAESREEWSPDRASPHYVGGALRDNRTGHYVQQWMHAQRELGAAERAVAAGHKGRRAKGNRHPESLAHDRREIGGFNLSIERHVPDSGYRYVMLSPKSPDRSRWGGEYRVSSDEQRYRWEWARERRRAVGAMWDLRTLIGRPNASIALEDLPGAGAIFWRDRSAVVTDKTDDIVDALAQILGIAKQNRAPRRAASRAAARRRAA